MKVKVKAKAKMKMKMKTMGFSTRQATACKHEHAPAPVQDVPLREDDEEDANAPFFFLSHTLSCSTREERAKIMHGKDE